MPTKPNKRKRNWVTERKQHQRSVDNSWFYNDWRWRKFSKAFKRRHPLCIDGQTEGIDEATTVTDHKYQFAEGAPGWDLNNLKDKDFEPRCDQHHNSRSGKQAHGKG